MYCDTTLSGWEVNDDPLCAFVLFLDRCGCSCSKQELNMKGDPPVGSVPSSSWPSTVPRYQNVNLAAFLTPKPLRARNAARRKLCLLTDDYGNKPMAQKKSKPRAMATPTRAKKTPCPALVKLDVNSPGLVQRYVMHDFRMVSEGPDFKKIDTGCGNHQANNR